MLNPYDNQKALDSYAKAGIETMSMELMPRITRAQSMDVLSSPSNLAGYKAVLDATAEFGRALPMMMTAAGTIAPAKVLYGCWRCRIASDCNCEAPRCCC